MLVLETQCYENYAWNEDGSVGIGSEAYWKAKGGSSYKVTGIPSNIDLEEVVSIVRDQIERASDYFMETVISWGVESDDWMSWYEKSQLEYDGEIAFPEPTMEYCEILKE